MVYSYSEELAAATRYTYDCNTYFNWQNLYDLVMRQKRSTLLTEVSEKKYRYLCKNLSQLHLETSKEQEKRDKILSIISHLKSEYPAATAALDNILTAYGHSLPQDLWTTDSILLTCHTHISATTVSPSLTSLSLSLIAYFSYPPLLSSLQLFINSDNVDAFVHTLLILWVIGRFKSYYWS